MNRNMLLVWIVAFCCGCTVYAGAVYTDCERPPTILHGHTELSVDDDGIIVTAQYICDAGYHLHGQSQLTCDTDTDEWQGDLPACKLETGNNSTVSEIESPEMIEAVVTVSPEITHEEVVQPVEEPTKNEVNINEIIAPPSQAPPSESESPEDPPPETPVQETPAQGTVEEETVDQESTGQESPESPDQESSQPEEQLAPNSNASQKKRRRKGKISEFQEDNNIDDDFASRLDMSCIEGTVAPAVNDAYIVEYIRAKKDEYKFLVAVYACDEDFYLENPQSNRLYCSQGIWVGNYPVCVSKGGESDLDYGNETDDDDQNGNNNNRKTDAENAATNSLQQNNENESHVEKNEASEVSETIPTAPTNNNIDEQIATNEIIPSIGTSEAPIVVQSNNEVPTADTCEVNNGGCEHTCTMVPDEEIGTNVVECSCREGFYLDSAEGKKCSDINECEYPNICPNGCENSIGSYRCLEENSDVEIIPTNVDVPHTTEFNAPVKACGDGLRLDDSNNCIDIDECAEGNTGCEYCQNTVGSFQCTCPDGYELNNDEKTCRDIDECTTLSDYEYEDNTPTAKSICSHECINTVGSYICRCPHNYHLREDKRTCEQDFCKHLNDISANKTKCSYDCVDETDGYHCKCPDNMKLDVDMKTCISQSLDTCSTSGDRCLPGKCINNDDGSFRCECPTGFAEYNQRCIDYDECAIGTHKCSHKCKNIDGSYMCECPDDLVLANDKHTCVSTDFCATNNGGCSDICNVVNEKVVCSCLDGAVLDTDGLTCRQKNICTENNGGCQQVCNAELNRCECFPGYETFDDGKTCRDLNECLQNNGGCPQQCSNTEGGFECTCFEGFQEDEETGNCIDRNECEANNGNCDHECSNTQGAYLCSCRPGYSLSADQHHCFDTNECEKNNGNCSDTCVNLQGSYQCTCPEGQFLVNDDHTCEYLNECEVNNGGCSHKCNYKKGVITCSCPVGFELEEAGKVCIDQNECLINNGGCAHHCENLNGTHVCKCRSGYQLASDKYACLDVDECIENNGNCSNICINLLGTYSCACEVGFELKADKHTCHDIDECTGKIHDCEQICVNVPGAYECECQPGYKLGRDKLSCHDIDECALPNACADDSKCVNTAGSYYCNCPIGYELSESKQCVDKNECNENSPKHCSHECINTPGSFKCACPKGLELSADQTTCTDVNECIVNAGACSHFCDNVEGSFVCRCPSGYELSDDQVTCKDINECTISNGGCEQKCVNIEGSSYCECDIDGFVLADDKKSCISSDPCGLKNGGCAHVCEPLNGKPQCFCYKGFELSTSDNSSCSDINECLLNHGCESKCVNTIGSYRCDCPKGFRLNAAGNCEDVNECEVYENGGCSPNSECINFLGSFRCICPTGYKLDHDKVTCVEIKDTCSALAAPEHGHVRCTRSRHMSQLFYRTKCSFWCDEGFTLMGPSFKYCNGTDGIWDMTETICVQSTCPPLAIQHPGTMTDSCLNGKTYPGQSCALICPPGFKSTASGVTQCLPNREWSRTDLHCQPIQTHRPAPKIHQQPHLHAQAQPKPQPLPQPQPHPQQQPYPQSHPKQQSKPKTRVQGGETHSRGHVDLTDSEYNGPISTYQTASSQGASVKTRPQNILRPYIKCPRDTTIVLPKNKKTVYVKLEQPKSNVNWVTHVDASPPWAKNLQAHLAAGVHTITFRARSPHSASISEVCRTVLTVKSANTPQTGFIPVPGPQVHYCPQTLDVQLQPHELQRAIFWREPQFQANQPLKQIFKSHLPGTKFGVGHHIITYIATDVRNQNQTCQFTIAVRPAVLARVVSPYVGPQFNHLDNHESYLLCPGKPAMKLDTNFPIQIPGGCIIKNVRMNQPLQYNPHRRRQAFPQSFSPNNNFLRYYSSWNWNRPEYNRYFL